MDNEKMFSNEVDCSNYWDNSMDIHQTDPFESALSSMVSSPTASNNGNDNNIVVRELIGRLGTICSSDYNYNNSTNTSCYSTPLNSPPKLNLSIMENRDFPILPPFAADPGFAHRAAAFSSKLTSSDSRDNSSSLSEQQQIPVGGLIDPNSRKKRKSIPKGNKGKQPSAPKPPNTNIGSENSDSSAKRSKSEENEKETENQKQLAKDAKALEAPKDYIHVRARRGQATDAHSLAERVRREKISERMKVLQDLVPGCNKVTGKAVMLDEIINYVQSLQRQVEFLSMKLATVNPNMDEEVLMSNAKDMFESRGSLPHSIYPPDSFHFPSQPNIANNFSAAFGRNQSLRIDNFNEMPSQVSTFWGDDLHSVVQMRYNQNETQDFHGVQMKVEL